MNLLRAAKNGKFEIMKDILKKEPHIINEKDEDGWTCLHWVCYNGYDEIFQFLIDFEGLDINAVNNYKQSSLMIAFRHNNSSIVEILLSHSLIDPNLHEKFKNTALHYCVGWNNIECCELLCSHPSIDLELKNKYGNTPLQLAVYDGRHEIIKILLQKGSKCKGWKEQEFYSYVKKEYKIKTKKILSQWKRYLPFWSIFNHKNYPKEFEDLSIICLLTFKKIEENNNLFIPKDIKRLLLSHIAEVWKQIDDEIDCIESKTKKRK